MPRNCEVKQIAWIEYGVKAARAVCRVLTPEGLGTGFLVDARTLMTNHHVIGTPEAAKGTKVEFNDQYPFASEGKPADTVRYDLDPDALFRTSATLDYTVVAVKPSPAAPPVESWGVLHLNPNADPIPTEHVVIVQHPNPGTRELMPRLIPAALRPPSAAGMTLNPEVK